MQLGAYEIALIAGGFGIVGALLGGFVSYRLALHIATVQFDNSVRLARINFFKEAANNLRAAFVPQLAAVRLDQSKSAIDIQKLLEPSIAMQTIEMEKFRFFVSPDQLSAYDEACRQYQSIARIRAMNYETLGSKEPFKVFDDRIHGVLLFAKP
jgi:hypothetical protein